MAEFSAVIELAALDGTTGLQLVGVGSAYRTSVSIASAGDINGDGFDDVIVGAWGANPDDKFTAGSSYVVFGKADGFAPLLDLSSLDGSNGFRLDGGAAGDRSGEVASAGDVNGDGFDDIIIGASHADNNGTDSGSSYVIFGHAGPFDPSFDLSAIDGTNGFRLDGQTAFDRSGQTVASAGDVNGDGFDDVLVGALSADPNGNVSAGSSYVVFGRADGFSAGFDLSALDGTDGFRLDGGAAGDWSGHSLSSAGDIDGDGFDDLVIGAPYADPGGEFRTGSSYVVFGRANGFDPVLNLSALDGTNGFRIDGADEGDRSGLSVSSAGDVNGDGFSDLIIGANFADPDSRNLAGSSFVVFGHGSGFDAILDLSLLDGNNGFRLDGAQVGGQSGLAVSSAGDVNADGFDDIIIGAPFADSNGNFSSGASYVVFGRASGLPASLDLATLNGTNGFRLDGAAGDDQSGRAVASAGDVNGDGFDDLLVGAPYADPNGNSLAGTGYIVFGRAPDGPVTRVGGAADQKIIGGAFDDTLSGLGGADDLRGGAGNDTLIGGIGGDALDGGPGSDTASYHDAATGVVADLADPSNNTGEAAGDSYVDIENLTGGDFADVLTGNAGANLLFGGAHNDTLIGGAGGDTLNGGTSGLDTASYRNATAGVVADLANPANNAGEAAGDSYASIENLEGSDFDDVLVTHAGFNDLFGRAGNDTLIGGVSGDDLDGGSGTDTASYRNAAAGVVADLANPASNTGDATGDSYVSIENLEGGDFADQLAGDAAANLLFGGEGDDRLLGRSGDDRLIGAPGNDRLLGALGHDTLLGGAGNDVLRGGGGADKLRGHGGEDVLIGGGGHDDLRGHGDDDALRGGSGEDRLIGGGGNDDLRGNGEDDVLLGGGGNDVLLGNGGHDRLVGGAGEDTLNGGFDDDVLVGGGGNDRLVGGGGNDVLLGDAGNDLLIGNAGADRFVFRPDGGDDVVVDFQDGLDRLVLRAFDFASKSAVLDLATQAGADVLIALPDGATIELNNFDLTLLGGEDILI